MFCWLFQRKTQHSQQNIFVSCKNFCANPVGVFSYNYWFPTRQKLRAYCCTKINRAPESPIQHIQYTGYWGLLIPLLLKLNFLKAQCFTILTWNVIPATETPCSKKQGSFPFSRRYYFCQVWTWNFPLSSPLPAPLFLVHYLWNAD